LVKKLPETKLIVGYLVEDLQDPFHLELIRELDNLLHEVNGGLIVAQGEDDSRLLSMGINRAVKHNTLYQGPHTDRVPTVYIGNVTDDVDTVVSDIQTGMEMIFNHLKDLGHRRIAYASQFTKEIDVQYPHLISSMSMAGMKLAGHFVINPHQEYRYEKIIKTFAATGNGPTALICYSDWLAMSFLEAAKKLKMEIPKSLSLTGYDDLYMSSLLQVPLTTIRFSRSEIARKIMEMLLRPSGVPRKEIVETKLIARDSTASLV
jgi:LacI family transcriptional regulator